MADQDWKNHGWMEKYIIRRYCDQCEGTGRVVEGTRLCHACEGRGWRLPSPEALYFVLRLDCGPDGPHDPNARIAMKAYADAVRTENPKFADDIMQKLAETAPLQEAQRILGEAK